LDADRTVLTNPSDTGQQYEQADREERHWPDQAEVHIQYVYRLT
jgi:hypothetical protein